MTELQRKIFTTPILTTSIKIEAKTRNKRSPVHNSSYPKGGVSCFADSFVIAESSVLLMKFSRKNPALRVATKRYHSKHTTYPSCFRIFSTELSSKIKYCPLIPASLPETWFCFSKSMLLTLSGYLRTG